MGKLLKRRGRARERGVVKARGGWIARLNLCTVETWIWTKKRMEWKEWNRKKARTNGRNSKESLRRAEITRRRRGAQQHTATHCRTLQHTATHCSTLQVGMSVRAMGVGVSGRMVGEWFGVLSRLL